ncbi:TRNA-specific adenosine deaminase [Phytophthora cinnamomi]|uniref:TRNA-specific adenosine deaminase n=1 Tax=Phytophthora cinnamomi TaxID=4785 RepID=UPI00355977CD|nr:TRNA-specific adenosine deaminase [Phytophthora cinnamomi]
MPSPAIAAGVAQAVLQWFDSSSQCQKKIPASEWTVLAGVVLHTCASSSPSSDADAKPNDAFRVLATATGNKCLGRRDLNADGLVVNDCHAEVLARRAFLRYLYAEALHCRERGLESSEQSIFERHPTSQRLVLKPQHSLHLFISEAPCGDAAIYELREDVVDELVHQREARAKGGEAGQTDDQTRRSELRLTGAKAHVNKRPRAVESGGDHDTPPDKRFAQAVGIARVKSGRSDLPVDKQTLSMSCSDKLAKWNALGLQGSLLLQFYEPVFLSSIVVSEDEHAMSVTKQQHALQRAVSARLEGRSAMIPGARLSSCETCVISDMPQFARQRKSNLAPSSLALNWTTKESCWVAAGSSSSSIAQNSHANPTNATKFATKFFNNFEIEFLMAATGFKQGAKKASKMDLVAMERVASRLSKRNLLRAFHHILGQTLLSGNANDLEYLQLKLAVPLAASSDGALSASASTAVITSNDQRKRFFAAFSDWIGVPTSFKQFKL